MSGILKTQLYDDRSSGTFLLLIIFSVCYISTVLLHKVNLVFIFVGMQAKKWKIVGEIQ